jgi:hypothetical protein
MSTFESLEDSFLKKSSEPIGTDYQEIQRRKAEATQAGNPAKELYEDSLKKKSVVSGLAAMLEAQLKTAREREQEDTENESESEESTTVTFVTNSVRYEDEVMIPQNEVSEEDIQRFYPHEKYNDVYTSPEEALKESPRFEERNKYGDMINQFEPKTASEDDISEGRSISTITAPGEPSMNPSSDEVMKHIAEYKQRTNVDNLPRPESANYKETELSKEEHEANLRELHNNDLSVEPTEEESQNLTQPPFSGLQDAGQVNPEDPIIPEELNAPTDLTQPPFKVTQESTENQQEQESSEEDFSETE